MIQNIEDFKKIDNTKHNIVKVSKSHNNISNGKTNAWVKDENSINFNNKSLHSDSKKGSLKKSSNRLYHANSNAEFVLSDFDFHLTREQKK